MSSFENSLIECVPNFSEGNDMNIINAITREIESVEGVLLLNVDPGKATNRTVVTFVGPPDPVSEAAFRAIKKASELIDMRKHKGEHPRMGATDVCPFIPVSGISLDETAILAGALGARVGNELKIPVYLYEQSQKDPARKNLSVIRSGEYEGFFKKIKSVGWQPDFGPKDFPAGPGATVIGARDFLVAYNVNLNTTSVRKANSIAFDVREAGRVKRSGDPLIGKIELDAQGNEIRIPGSLKAVKAIGWFIKEYGTAQISMNLTNIGVTPLHIAFDEVVSKAQVRGIRVTGSELVGLLPLKCMTDAGKYFLKKQQASAGVSEKELVSIAIRSMGLDELSPFDPDKKIIEYVLRQNKPQTKLSDLSLSDFADETASDSPAPGGGSISAYAGVLGISLGIMVANLSASKRGWDHRWEEFSAWAEKGQGYKSALLELVNEDTKAFNAIMDAYSLPKGSDEEKESRKKAIQSAMRYATEVPFKMMEIALASMEVIKAMTESGNPNSVTDAGVGALCARTAVSGAFLNVRVNASGLDDKDFSADIMAKASKMELDAKSLETIIIETVTAKLT
jgi:glutamate formiminotransferase/formiminotetrahydrofolate cyclodeaminase